jgi:glycerophosphoryl diester phosphodiesterase
VTVEPPLELRVHGVGGPQARKMLGESHEEDVVTLGPFPAPGDAGGNGTAIPVSPETRFARRLLDDGTEAYEWGALTTGSWAKALWVVYLPFTLINAAGWAHHAAPVVDEGRRLALRLHLMAVHLLAALATATYVLWVGYIALDLLAVRWRTHVLTEFEVTGIARDAAGAWLPVLGPAVFLALVGGLFLAPVLRGRFEEVGGAERGAWPIVPAIARRSFFAMAGAHRHRQAVHLVVAAVVALAAVGQYAAGWHRLGLAIVVVGALQAFILFGLCVTDVVGRLRHRCADAVEGYPGATDGVWDGLAWIPVGSAFAVLGTAIAHSAFAGTAMLLRPVLARWPEADPADVLAVGPELGSADIMGGTVAFLGVLGVGLVFGVWRSRRRETAEDLLVGLARRARAVGLVALLAGLGPVAVYIWRNARKLDLGGDPLRWWTEFVRWYDGYEFDAAAPLQLLGSAVLVALPPVVFGILRGAHDSGPARIVGNVWDVLTFWPRRFHPLAVPPSAERAVPELRARIEDALRRRVCLVVAAHSQGSVLAAAAVASAERVPGSGLHLVTFGSPLGTLYGQVWPAYVPALLRSVSERVEPHPGWVSFWRPTDPIGAGVPYARNRCLADPQTPGVGELEDARNRRPLERPRPWGTIAGHSHYLADPEVRAALQVRRCPRLRAAVPADGAAGDPRPPGPPPPARVVRWAHQGGAREAPSNTLAAMERAMSDGKATALEFDVHRSADGTLVLIHDWKLDRTTNGRGKVRRRRFSDLGRLDAAWWWVRGEVADHDDDGGAYVHRYRALADPMYRIPTLDEVLRRFPATPMTIEIKAWRAARPLVDQLARSGRGDVTVTSFFDPIVWRVRWRLRHQGNPPVGLAPGLVYSIWFLVRTKLGIAPRTARYSRMQIPPRKAGLRFGTPRFVAAAQQAGMAVDLWTIDEQPMMLRAIYGLHVDGIMTDVPSVLAATVASLPQAE